MPIAAVVRSFMADRRQTWRGTATDLLHELDQLVFETVRRDPAWPKRANALSGQLKRLAPNLRHVGIEVVTGIREPGGRRRVIQITSGHQ